MKNKLLDFFTFACYALVGIIILTLFVENFIFSNSFGLLGFRELDDIAFQGSIRTMHNIASGGYHDLLLVKNDYAYGWIYWATTGLVTYPLYYLSITYAVDWPLIVVPRQLSLMFTILSLVVLRKMLKGRSAPEWACAAGLLIFALYPAVGYFSLRFGTVNAILFFSLLSVYLAQQNIPSTLTGRILIAVVLAIAGGIKLSGLLIAPVVFAFILLRMEERGLLRVIRALIIPFLIFIVLLAFFTNPAMVIHPSDAKIRSDYWTIVTMFINNTKIPFGPADPATRLFLGVFGSALSAATLCMLALGFLFYLLKEKTIKFDLLAIVITLSLAAGYLMHSVKNYISIGSYFSAVSFLLILGIVGWAKVRFGIFAIILMIAFQISDLSLRTKDQWLTQSSELNPWMQWNHLNYFLKELKNKTDIDSATSVDACMNMSKQKPAPFHVVIDHTLPTTINPPTYPYACVSMISNNLSLAVKNCAAPINYVILDKLAFGAAQQAEFDEKTRTFDAATAEVFLNDRAARIALVTSGKFHNQQFKPACEYGRYQVFKAVEEPLPQ